MRQLWRMCSNNILSLEMSSSSLKLQLDRWQKNQSAYKINRLVNNWLRFRDIITKNSMRTRP